MSLRIAATLMLVATVACSGPRAGTGSTSPTSRKVLGTEDLDAARAQGIGNAYDMVSRMRPEWLLPQTVGTAQVRPSAWLDRQRLGEVTALASVPLASIIEVRYLTPSDARGELGPGNQGGAIVALTR